MSGCQFPEHHRGGGGAPTGLIVFGVVVLAIAGTSTAARVAADLIEAVMFTIIGLVAIAAAGGTWLSVRAVRRRRRAALTRDCRCQLTGTRNCPVHKTAVTAEVIRPLSIEPARPDPLSPAAVDAWLAEVEAQFRKGQS